MSSELAVIQGPPGTGKTFVGCKIVQLLLANSSQWSSSSRVPARLQRRRLPTHYEARLHENVSNRPILLVCYTNHALDSFLEFIMKFTNAGDVIRVGGRCKNEEIKDCLLPEVRRTAVKSGSVTFPPHLLEEQRALDNEVWDVQAKKFKLDEFLGISQHLVMGLGHLETDMTTEQKDSFMAATNRRKSSGDIIRHWLMITNKNEGSCLDEGCEDGDSQVIVPEQNTVLDMVSKVNLQGVDENTVQYAVMDENVDKMVKEFANINNMIIEDDTLVITSPRQANNCLAKQQTNQQQQHSFESASTSSKRKGNSKITQYNDGDAFKMVVSRQHRKQDVTSLINDQRHVMSKQHADAVTNVWTLNFEARWELYRYWLQKFRKRLNDKIDRLLAVYRNALERLRGLREVKDRYLLRSAKVIGMTTSGAARYQKTLQQIQPAIVIIEEAAEVLEAHIITSLSRDLKHLILIGDHYQLRPSPSNYELEKNYNLGISLFERLINNGLNHACLELQHRMRPEISGPLMPHFYPNLRNHASVQDYDAVRGVTSNVCIITHDHPEDGENSESTTHRSSHEAGFVVGLGLYFIQQGYSPSQITILTPYLGQLFDIMNRIKTRAGQEGICAALLNEVRVTAVDNYQGEENDIVILSLVRSVAKDHDQIDNKKTTIGFLARKNRVCVALSRAKMGLFVVGNFTLFASKTPFWSDICDSLTRDGLLREELSLRCSVHERIVAVRREEDIRAAAPDGGCTVPCVARLVCGHACKRLCHPHDPEHKQIKCSERCPIPCTTAPPGVTHHKCNSICSNCWIPSEISDDTVVHDLINSCKPCSVLVDRILDRCGHLVVNVPCGEEQSATQCQHPCQIKLSCGHQCAKKCHPDGVSHTEYCREDVYKLRDCGHMIKIVCNRDPNKPTCSQKVTKRWPGCEHDVENVDCSTDVLTAVCPAPCTAVLQCEHVCAGSCATCLNGRLHIRCQQKCERVLFCGHVCPETCCTPCPPCKRPCETKCEHSFCSIPPSNRECGMPCPMCKEKCSWACDHQQCDLLCAVPCVRPKCNEPCNLSQSWCGHPCMGLCGEPCPKICRPCQPLTFKEHLAINFCINEDDDDVRFYTLPDCGHTMEVESLDRWIETRVSPISNPGESSEISLLVCPACKQPIRTAKRYSKEIKKNTSDVNAVKCVILTQGTGSVPITTSNLSRDPTERIKEEIRLERDRLTVIWQETECRIHKYSDEAMDCYYSIFKICIHLIYRSDI